MVKRSEIVKSCGLWLEGLGLSVESETLGLSSRVRRAASSLQMQPEVPVVASYGPARTATVTAPRRRLEVVRAVDVLFGDAALEAAGEVLVAADELPLARLERRVEPRLDERRRVGGRLLRRPLLRRQELVEELGRRARVALEARAPLAERPVAQAMHGDAVGRHVLEAELLPQRRRELRSVVPEVLPLGDEVGRQLDLAVAGGSLLLRDIVVRLRLLRLLRRIDRDGDRRLLELHLHRRLRDGLRSHRRRLLAARLAGRRAGHPRRRWAGVYDDQIGGWRRAGRGDQGWLRLARNDHGRRSTAWQHHQTQAE